MVKFVGVTFRGCYAVHDGAELVKVWECEICGQRFKESKWPAIKHERNCKKHQKIGEKK
jgi:hypothetical protein